MQATILPDARIGEARINGSQIAYSGLVLSVFNYDGTYNATDWSNGDLLTEAHMDKIEGALTQIRYDQLQKYDDVAVEKNGATNTLTFYANGKEKKKIDIVATIPQAGTLEINYPEYTTIKEKEAVIIPYVFNTTNRGDATLYVSVVVGESSKELEYKITKIGGGSVNLGNLNKGINQLSFYVVDSAEQITNIVNITIVCGALEIKSTFDDSLDYYTYSIINIPFTVNALDKNDTMTLKVDIDGILFEREVIDGYNTFSFPNELKTIGVHRVSMQVTSNGGFYTDILKYNIVIASATILLISVDEDTYSIQEGYNITIPYRISMLNQSLFKAEYYINNELYREEEVELGKHTFEGSYKDFTIGEYKLKIKVYTIDGTVSSELIVTINITSNSFKRITHVEGGLQVYFDMSAKTNSSLDRDYLYSEVLTDEGKYAKLELHDYNYSSNGWIDDRLVSNGKAWAEITNYKPLVNNAIDGFTFDILFSSNNLGENEARVIDCTSNDEIRQGFYINSELASITTSANNLSTYYTDRTDMRVTFVINRTSTYYEEYIKDENGNIILNPNPTYKPNPMVQTYINGILTDVAMLSDQGVGNNKIYEGFQHNENILINTDRNKALFGSNSIKSIRIYNRPLEYEEILQNYIADYDDLMEQKEIYDKNYVTINSDLPTLNFYDTDIGKHDLMTKDIKQWMHIVYTSPNTELFGESFDLMGQTSWQGTSSLGYPIKNYKFKLYDWARDDDGQIIEALRNYTDSYTKKKINMYPSDGNGHKENTFCLKADYMDSSHCRNTGTARLVNDLLFDGYPNPAKQKDPITRDTINGFPCNLYINGKWIGIYNFNHDKSCTKTLGMETIPNTVRWEIKANSDTSAGAFFKTWKNVDECYEAINSDFEIVYDEDAFEDKTGEYDVTKYYDELGFSHNGIVMGTYYDYAILSLARFVNWVSGADEEEWKANSDKYFNKIQACRYYLNVMTLGMIDNFAKNCIINMYGDDVWWFSFYDMDSSLGLDNTGYNKFSSNIEPSQPGIYNCSTSQMWAKLNAWSQDDIFNQFKIIREGKYTYENICKYLIEKQIDVIPQILYNRDMYSKYISQGRQFLHMLHGNNKDHLKRWIYNRFQYVDSLFLQQNSPYTKQNITIRSCKPTNAVPKYDEEGNIISQYTARFEIQTYCPQYVTVCWRNGLFETKRIDWGETGIFEYDMVNSQDNELILYCAGNLKYIGDISGLNPTSMIIDNATRLMELICEDSDKLVKADISKNSYLKRVSFKNCSVLGTASGGANVIDISAATNLREIDLRGTKITSVIANAKGGNIESILYPSTIQDIVLSNQVNLEVIGIPPDATKLINVQIIGCNMVKTLVYPYDEEIAKEVSFECVDNLTINNSCNKIEVIYLKDASTLSLSNMSNLEKVIYTPNAEHETFDIINLTNTKDYNITTFNCPKLTTFMTTAPYRNSYGKEYGEVKPNEVFEANIIDISNTQFTDVKLLCTTDTNVLKLPQTTKNLIIDSAYDLDTTYLTDGDYNTIHTELIESYNTNYEGKVLLNGKTPNLIPSSSDGSIIQSMHIPSNTAQPVSGVWDLEGIELDQYHTFGLNNDVKLANNTLTLTMPNRYDDYSLRIKNKTVKNEIARYTASDWNTLPTFNSGFTYTYDMTKLNDEVYEYSIMADSMDNLPTSISFSGKSNLLAVEYLNINNVTRMNDMFRNCNKLTSLDVSKWDTSKVTTMDSMFYNCNNLTSLDLSNWDTSEVTTMYCIFYGCNNLTTLDVSNWDTSKVGNMGAMFYNCYNLTLLDVSNWDTKNVTRMDSMFNECNKLTSLNVSNFITSNVTKIDGMFNNCQNLTSLNVSNFNTRNITNMGYMFNNCKSLAELDVSNFNTSIVTDMSYMFNNCQNLTSLNLSNFDTSKVTTMSSMFNNCASLQELHIELWKLNDIIQKGVSTLPIGDDKKNIIYASVYFVVPNGWTLINVLEIAKYTCSTSGVLPTFNSEYSGYSTQEIKNENVYIVKIATNSMDNLPTQISFNGRSSLLTVEYLNVNNVTTMYQMFNNCNKLTSLNVSNFNTINVTNMSGMFNNCTNLTSLDASNFDTINVTDMSYMFNNCNNLTELNVSSFNVINVINMSYMFYDCNKLTELDVSNFITSKATNMSSMFYNCKLLTSLDVSNFNTSIVSDMHDMFCNCNNLAILDVSNFITSNAINMNGMFCNCTNLFSLDVGDFITSNVTNMGSMFYNCTNLASLDVSWNTSKVDNMSYMFYNCKSLTELDVSNFNTRNVTTMNSMFYNCNNLTSLNVSNWDTDNVTTMNSMFNGCNKLTSLNISNFDIKKVIDMNQMLYGCTSLQELYIESWVLNDITQNGVFSLPIGDDTKNEIYASAYFEVPNGWALVYSNLYDIAIYTCNTFGVLPTFNTTYTEYSVEETNNGNGTYTTYIRTNDLDVMPTSISFNGKSSLLSVEKLNVTNVTTMKNMFSSCTSLTSIEGTKTWNTSKVTNMNSMFSSCTSLKTVDVSSWDTSKVTDMTGMFVSCRSLTDLDVSNWDTSKVTKLTNTFQGCTSLKSLDVSKWKTSNVTSMSSTFQTCNKFTSLDVSKWDTSKVTGMNTMFTGCSSLTSLDVSNFNTSKVTNMTYMFGSCAKLTSLDLSNFNTSSVTNMSNMFTSCQNLTSLNLSGWETSSVTVMNNMFHDCKKLTNLEFAKNLDTSKVTNMNSMFKDCSGLTSLEGIKNWNTSSVTNMNEMFSNCNNVPSIDLSSWDTSSVIYMTSIFGSCYGLTSIDLSSWDTSKVTSMTGMFVSCSKLTSLDSMTNISTALDLSYTILDTLSLLDVIDNLATVTTTKTLKLGTTLLAKLTTDQIAVGTNKGWTIV